MSALLRSVLLVLKELLRLVFPLSEDEQIIADISPSDFTHKLQIQNVHSVVTVTSYSDPAVRAAVHLNKFHRHGDARRLLAALFETWLRAHVTEPAVVIPVPLSKKRERQRGYNQVTIVADEATRSLSHIYVETKLLSRPKHTPPQTTLTRAERLKNMTNAFRARTDLAQGSLAGKHVILLDDVMTTGATLKAAKAALSPLSPSKITCVALAH